MIPKSGGDYAYINDAFGPLPAFLYLYVALFVLVPTGNAITALTFAQYILQPVWHGCVPPYAAVRLLAAVITCKNTLEIIVQHRPLRIASSLNSRTLSAARFQINSFYACNRRPAVISVLILAKKLPVPVHRSPSIRTRPCDRSGSRHAFVARRPVFLSVNPDRSLYADANRQLLR